VLLVLEIILTVVAWKRGWRWLALLPLGSGLLTAFALGFVMGALGASENHIFVIGLACDLVAIVGLCILIATHRKPAPAMPLPRAFDAAATTSGDRVCPDCGLVFRGLAMLSWHINAVHAASRSAKGSDGMPWNETPSRDLRLP
jgi:hypothetical protein